MVFISRLKLRNFKSFRIADIQLPQTYLCLAGPNGSGKSNICDSIRFVMGEISLRSLRARKIKDLIHTDAKSAEVVLVIEDPKEQKSYEIKRAIREDGKTLYKINRDRATRTSVLELLKKHNLDNSGRNIVAQGEVAKIIHMNGKERRAIIDSVAGISDFDEKKKEALHELTVVDTRIKDSNLVLGERRAFIEQLGREKEEALKFVDLKKRLTNAKATVLQFEIQKTDQESRQVEQNLEKFDAEYRVKEKEIRELETQIKAAEELHSIASRELQSKQDSRILIRKIEELKANVASKEQSIKDKHVSVEKTEDETKKINHEIQNQSREIKKIKEEITTLENSLDESKMELSKWGAQQEDDKITKIRERQENCETQYFAIKEGLISIRAEIKSKIELIEAKRQELVHIEKNVKNEDEGISKSMGGAGEEPEEDSDPKHRINKIVKELEQLFKRTKEINIEITELDRKVLELKEKSAIYKVRSVPHLANPALSLIKDLKQKGERGIYGIVADLIKTESKFSQAVESAAANRLMYVVVDRVDTATKIIEKLKAVKAGRATFIPLESIRPIQIARVRGYSSLIEVVEFSEEVRPAIEYVFGETVLIEKPEDAKKISIGTVRMVTFDGEIFEKSGIISGGRGEGGALAANQIRKIEEEIFQLKSEKEELLQELYSIRDSDSKLRTEKSQLEVKLKTVELLAERKKETVNLIKRREMLNSEIEELSRLVEEKKGEAEKLEGELTEVEHQLKKILEEMEKVEEEIKDTTQKTSKNRADLSAKVSSLRATLDGRRNEIVLREKEIEEKQKKIKEYEGEKHEILAEIKGLHKQLELDKKELVENEEKLSTTSKQIEHLFEKLKATENDLSKLGKELGIKKLEIDRINKEINQLNVRKATAITHLQDIKTEFENYKDAEILDMKREELIKIISESEKILSEMPNVNMAAIDMYDKKKAEIEDVENKIKTLDKEREAILEMINEIEERKRGAFFETFSAVSEQFCKMFKHIDIGEGYLVLDKPATPFESGLFIKIRRNNKEHSLEALSGGEKTLVALMFVFALQFFKPAPFYILDEVDAALDKQNSKRLAELISKMAQDSQFILVSHNDTVMVSSETVIGVSKLSGVSKLVGIKLKQAVLST